MLISCADLGDGPEGPRHPFFCRNIQKIYEKNTEMKAQMPFSGPLFPELGSRPLFSNFLDIPLNMLMFPNRYTISN